MLVVFAETPGANYGLAQFFHQDQDGDDRDHDYDRDDLMMVTMSYLIFVIFFTLTHFES